MELRGMTLRSLQEGHLTAARIWRGLRIAAILGIVCLLFSASGRAQFDTGTIVGLVTDLSGAVIPNATATITNTGTGIGTTLHTGNDGSFVASGLPFGHYVVSATATNFGQAT